VLLQAVRMVGRLTTGTTLQYLSPLSSILLLSNFSWTPPSGTSFPCKSITHSNVFSVSGLLGLLLFYLTAFLFSMPSIANLFQPQLNGLMFSIIGDIRYFYMILLVPLVALLPDFTYNLVNQVFYPGVEDILMFMSNELGG
jgi:hypothetical protein